MAMRGHLTSAQSAALDETIRAAEQMSRAEFSVFIGSSEGDPREFATRLHNTLVLPSRSVLIMVDPDQRAVEIVTGGHVRRNLTDSETALAVAEMTSSFAAKDLVGGLIRAIRLLAEHARP